MVGLTTTFTPPPSCTTDFYQADTTGNVWFASLGPGYDGTNCFPSGYNPLSQYYSPGLACPTGYTSDCQNTYVTGTVTETTATCCPSGYRCQMSSDYPWYTDHACTLLFDVKYSLTTTFTLTHSGSDGLEIVTIAGPAGTKGGVNAYGISMRWQATDLIAAAIPTVTSTSTTLTPRVIASETSAPMQTQSPVTPLPELSSNALSGGAIAGIVIGIIALVALIAGGMWFFLRARKRNAEMPKMPIVEVSAQGGREAGVTEYFLPKGEQSVGHQRQVSELLTPAQMVEVEGSVVSHEIPTTSQRSPVEMP